MSPRYDILPEQYPSALRDMLRHENDLTNHRLMWLLIGQGFIANAYINVGNVDTVGAATRLWLPMVGMLLTLSAFLLLYKSYQARGYIEFLGQRAKKGELQEEYLPLKGWPRRRIKDWSKECWFCPWLAKSADILEPWFFLPCLFMFTWMIGFLRALSLEVDTVVLLAIILTGTTFVLYCVVMVWLQGKDLERTENAFGLRRSKVPDGTFRPKLGPSHSPPNSSSD